MASVKKPKRRKSRNYEYAYIKPPTFDFDSLPFRMENGVKVIECPTRYAPDFDPVGRTVKPTRTRRRSPS